MYHSAAWLDAAVRSGALLPHRSTSRRSPRRLIGDRGEGVISAAIAVLIVAFLGAAMWITFNSLWSGVKANTCAEVNKIGSGGTPVKCD